MCRMKRTFHAIGQGAFYTEEFNNGYTMIYDCGTYHKKDIITNAIKSSDLSKDIDLLCISHFHKDHISGLEYLLQNYNVKKVLLPLLHDEEREEVFLTNLIEESSSFIQNLCLYPERTIREISEYKEVNIVFVQPYNEDNDFIEMERGNSTTTINSGTEIDINQEFEEECKWVYIPFNFEAKDRGTSLRKSIIDAEFNIDDFQNKYKSDKEYRKKVKEVYESLIKSKGDLNTNSLVLYSGINDKSFRHHSCIEELYFFDRECFCHFYHGLEAGCLYMGDYDAKTEENRKQFMRVFQSYFRKVGTIQIPHHGSSHNYSRKLNFKKGLLSVISAGKDTKYKHPHASTIRNIVVKNGIPILITEDLFTKFIQDIKCY